MRDRMHRDAATSCPLWNSVSAAALERRRAGLQAHVPRGQRRLLRDRLVLGLVLRAADRVLAVGLRARAADLAPAAVLLLALEVDLHAGGALGEPVGDAHGALRAAGPREAGRDRARVGDRERRRAGGVAAWRHDRQ